MKTEISRKKEQSVQNVRMNFKKSVSGASNGNINYKFSEIEIKFES